MKLTPHAVQNLDLLHALDAADEGASITGVARRLGRDRSNLSKTLDKLAEDGLVDPARKLALTAAGAALTRLVSADGELAAPTDVVLLRHDQIEPDPDNERAGDITPEAVDSLRESILLRGLLQPLRVTETETPGRYRLVNGERRWRAIGYAIHDGDWPADRPITAVVSAPLDPLARALSRLAENLQRDDLHPLDEGQAYRTLRDIHGLDTQDIADLVGRSRKHVQDHIAVVEKSSDDAKRRMRLPKDDPDFLTYREARHLMREHKPKPVIDVTPKEALVLLEVADRARRRPSAHKVWPGRDGWTELPHSPVGGAAGTLAAKGFLQLTEEQYGTCVFARVAPSPELLYWLVERGHPDKLEGAVWSARCDVVGAFQAAQLRQDGRYATDWLNAPAEATPPRARPEDRPTPEIDHEDHEDHEEEDDVEDVEDEDLADDDGGDDHEPLGDLRGLGGEPSPSPAPTAEPAPRDPIPLPPGARVALFEIGQAIAFGAAVQGPQAAYAGLPAFGYWNDRDAQALLNERLIKFQPAENRKDYLVCLTGRGHEHWRTSGEPPEALAGAGRRVTPWLNPPDPSAAKPTGPLAPMLGDAFAQQVRETAAIGDEAEPREPLDADIDLSLDGQITYLTEWREIVEVHEEPMIDAIIASLTELKAALDAPDTDA